MIETGILNRRDLPALATLWPEVACPLTATQVMEDVLLHGGEPRAILAIDPNGWLVARSQGQLAGFAHCTVGRLPQDDPESLRGFLRALVLAPDAPPATYRLLLRAADAYFRAQKDVTQVLAFHLNTGYPRLNHGRGTVRHDDWGLMSALGDAGYQLVNRWLFYEQDFEALMTETLPAMPDLRLRWDDWLPEHVALSVWSESALVARARFMLFPQPEACQNQRAASLYDLHVVPDFRGWHIGRWLLARGVNHLITRGITHLFEAVAHDDVAMHARLRSLDFSESPQRGYAYEKQLTPPSLT
jgi:GNAT superfamily N-acetyltransferase